MVPCSRGFCKSLFIQSWGERIMNRAARLRLFLLLLFALAGLSIPSFSADHYNDTSLGTNCKNQPQPYPEDPKYPPYEDEDDPVEETGGCKCCPKGYKCPGGTVDQLRGTLKEEYTVFNLCPPTCVRSGYGLPLPSVPKALTLTYINRYSTTASFGFGWSSG